MAETPAVADEWRARGETEPDHPAEEEFPGYSPISKMSPGAGGRWS